MSEQDENRTVVLTGAGVHMFRYLQLIHGLALEINSGMKLSSRGSVMNAAKEVCGSPKRTKRGVLADMVKFMRTQDPSYTPSDRVAKALAK